MFEPKINKSAPPGPMKNSLFYASCRMQDPDLEISRPASDSLIEKSRSLFRFQMSERTSSEPVLRNPSRGEGEDEVEVEEDEEDEEVKEVKKGKEFQNEVNKSKEEVKKSKNDVNENTTLKNLTKKNVKSKIQKTLIKEKKNPKNHLKKTLQNPEDHHSNVEVGRSKWSIESEGSRWSPSTKLLERDSYSYSSTEEFALKLQTKIRLSDEPSVSKLCVSMKNIAVTGAGYTVQVLGNSDLTTVAGAPTAGGGNKVVEVQPDVGHRLVGHTAPVHDIDFSRTGDWLVSGGQDMMMKLWDWKSRRVIMDINSKRGGYFEENYGVLRKTNKETNS
ncbi:uncharacterized protein LOC111708827 [Eurytemora carolleeae]|uniref:uncharacterized protein LOC111708827 n=1 Tax=Eurytemora carolleeae TaxID=1294199 RepID=UPI000C761327|nr:uncharacterized protein LOC111708827 [Eurytemora carolleeae]|eukprot:XP_023338092.1 uncharacterized protein LOC111708827 [Eurytemora affinis]